MACCVLHSISEAWCTTSPWAVTIRGFLLLLRRWVKSRVSLYIMSVYVTNKVYSVLHSMCVMMHRYHGLAISLTVNFWEQLIALKLIWQYNFLSCLQLFLTETQHLKIELTGFSVLVFKIWINSLSVSEIWSNIEAIGISVSAILSRLLTSESEVTRGAEQDLEVYMEVVLQGVIDCSGLECEVPGYASESGWLRNSSEIDHV